MSYVNPYKMATQSWFR